MAEIRATVFLGLSSSEQMPRDVTPPCGTHSQEEGNGAEPSKVGWIHRRGMLLAVKQARCRSHARDAPSRAAETMEMPQGGIARNARRSAGAERRCNPHRVNGCVLKRLCNGAEGGRAPLARQSVSPVAVSEQRGEQQ